MLIGIFIYLLLNAVPYVGWIIGMLVTAAGLGSAWLAYRTEFQNKPNIIPAPIEGQAAFGLKRKRATSNNYRLPY